MYRKLPGSPDVAEAHSCFCTKKACKTCTTNAERLRKNCNIRTSITFCTQFLTRGGNSSLGVVQNYALHIATLSVKSKNSCLLLVHNKIGTLSGKMSENFSLIQSLKLLQNTVGTRCKKLIQHSLCT